MKRKRKQIRKVRAMKNKTKNHTGIIEILMYAIGAPEHELKPQNIVKEIRRLTTMYSHTPVGIKFSPADQSRIEELVEIARNYIEGLERENYDAITVPAQTYKINDDKYFLPSLVNLTPNQAIKYFLSYKDYNGFSDKGDALAGVYLHMYYKAEKEILTLRNLEEKSIKNLPEGMRAEKVYLARQAHPESNLYEISEASGVPPILVMDLWDFTPSLQKYELYEAYLPINKRPL